MTLARFQMCIGGEWVDALSGKTFESLNPALAEPWAELPDADEADVERAVQAAQTAFDSPAWRGLTATARGKLLRRLGDLIAENKEHLAQLESRDNGKLIRETRGQVSYLPEFFHYTAGLADKLEGGTLPLDKPDLFAYTVHEAMGVVAAIIPWNSPLYLTAIKLAPALAAGNTIVIKPSEHASATILELARLALEAGIPPGVVNVVTGYGPSTGAALTRHPLVRKIAFTGGAATARHVVRSSAENFAKLSLELGGKSPNIVFDDADLDQAVKGAISGVFGASGQTCMAGSRLLVQKTIHDAFVEKLVAAAGEARIGDPSKMDTQIGPIATRPQWEKILRMIDMAKKEGAVCALGGHALSGPDYGQGQFVAPTIFTQVRNDMRIAQEEVFGPVLCVIPFEDEEDALRIANDVEFGLAAGVWTRDLHRAMYCVDRLRAGTVWVNNYRSTSFTTPFGGYKRSGLGREGGVEAIKEYLQTKSVWITTKPNRANPFVLG